MRSIASYKPASRQKPVSMSRLRRWVGGSYTPYLFIAPFFILFAFFGVYPLVYAFYLSFTYWHGADSPLFVGLSNYTFLLTDEFFWQSLLNSAVLWLLIVPLQTLFAILIAMLLSRATLRFRWFFRTALLTPYVVPLVAIAQVWLVLFDQDYGAINTVLQFLHIPAVGWLTTSFWAKPTLALMVFWKSSGFAIIVMLAALQNVPQEYYEAASIDGANSFHRFRFITIPLLRRTIGFFMIISTLGVIQMFAEPYILTQGGPYNSTTTAGYHLLSYINNVDFGTGAANSFLLMILVIVVAFVMLRLLRTGEEV